MESERKFNTEAEPSSTKICKYEGEFTGNKRYFCLKSRPYVILHNYSLYVFTDINAWNKYPKLPEKIFNLNTSTLKKINENHILLENEMYKQNLSHIVEEEIEELCRVIKHNKKYVKMSDIFPKKYAEIDENIEEKINFEGIGINSKVKTKPEGNIEGKQLESEQNAELPIESKKVSREKEKSIEQSFSPTPANGKIKLSTEVVTIEEVDEMIGELANIQAGKQTSK